MTLARRWFVREAYDVNPQAVPPCRPGASKKKLIRHCSHYFAASGWRVEQGAFGGDLALTKLGRMFHLVVVGADFVPTEVFVQDCGEIASRVPLPLVVVSYNLFSESYRQAIEERRITALHYLELPRLLVDGGADVGAEADSIYRSDDRVVSSS